MLAALAAGAAIGAAAVVAIVNERRNRRRRSDFSTHFRTREEFRKAVDADRIRSVRDTQSEMAAIRAVRTDFPGAPLDQVIRVVREL